MRNLLIATVIVCLLIGGIAGFAARAATEPTPKLYVSTDKINVITQTVKVAPLSYCHVVSTVGDPAAVYQFDEYITCSSTPVPNRRYPSP